MHFKNSHVQYPDFSLLGEPGQEKIVEIELQLLADVGLIGMPSVGKSSIINSVCNTKAKVAEYHFTTLIPNLGSVKYNDEGRNIIDIPGLVE
jgi:GTP-binding protein